MRTAKGADALALCSSRSMLKCMVLLLNRNFDQQRPFEPLLCVAGIQAAPGLTFLGVAIFMLELPHEPASQGIALP